MRGFRYFLGLIFLSAVVIAVDLPSRPTGYVSDYAGVLDGQSKAQLETLLTELNQKTSAEVAVVTVSSLDGQDIEGYANDLFKKWGIGKKGKDNGVLFLIAPTERALRIEVGYGLESILPDGYVGRIRDQNILPYFKSGHMSEGILQGTLALAQNIAQSAGVALSLSPANLPQQENFQGNPDAIVRIIIFVLFAVFVILSMVGRLFFGGWRGRGGGWSGGGTSGGGFSGGGFGGFGGGGSGGGGASGRW